MQSKQGRGWLEVIPNITLPLEADLIGSLETEEHASLSNSKNASAITML